MSWDMVGVGWGSNLDGERAENGSGAGCCGKMRHWWAIGKDSPGFLGAAAGPWVQRSGYSSFSHRGPLLA